jgi:hypothetical protein
MQNVIVQIKVEAVEYLGVDEAPSLYLATPHQNGGAPHAVDQNGLGIQVFLVIFVDAMTGGVIANLAEF